MDTESDTRLTWWMIYKTPKGKRGLDKISITDHTTTSLRQYNSFKASTSCMSVRDLCSRSPRSEQDGAMLTKQQGSGTDRIKLSLGKAKPVVWSLPSLGRSWRSKSEKHTGRAIQSKNSDFSSRELQHAPPLHRLQLFRGLMRSYISPYFLCPSRRAQKHDSVLDNVALLEMLSDPTLHNDQDQDNKPRPIGHRDVPGSDRHGGSCSLQQYNHGTNNTFFLQSRSNEQPGSDEVDTVRHSTSSLKDIKHKEMHFEKENTTRTSVNHQPGTSRSETTVSQAMQAVDIHTGLISSTEREKRSGRPEQQDSLDHSVPQRAMAHRFDHANDTLTVLVSTWLYFGRTLFSPAHLQAQGQPEYELLVVDSLGDGTLGKSIHE